MDDLFLPDVVYCDVQQISNALGVLVSDLATEYRMRTVESKGHESSFEAGLEHPFWPKSSLDTSRIKAG